MRFVIVAARAQLVAIGPLPSAPRDESSDGHVPAGLESSSEGDGAQGTLVSCRGLAPHQSAGVAGHSPGLEGLPPIHQGEAGAGSHGQCHVVLQQAG